jgi:tRNA A37 threonylcarbamoyladenosine biosynthesis protein TsaE
MVLHADLYRLDRISEVVDLALGELLEEDAVAMVEWGDAAAPVLGEDVLDVRFEMTECADWRLITVTPRGSAWRSRCPAVGEALSGWMIDARSPEP